jgi:agmatine deiminase
MFGSLYDSPWVRDYGPVQIEVGGDPVWLDFAYRGERGLDDGIPALLAEHLRIKLERYNVVLEGGALIGNGRGLCAMTEESLAETGVNPAEPEAVDWLLDRLGCRALALLPKLPGELTGHADMLAQFLAPDLVAVAEIDAAAAPAEARALELSVAALRAAAVQLGQPLEVLRLPMPFEGETFYSYVNGTPLRGYFLVPSYSQVSEEVEAEVYRRLDAALPHLELVPVPSDIMIGLGGAVHCMTLGLRLKRS